MVSEKGNTKLYTLCPSIGSMLSQFEVLFLFVLLIEEPDNPNNNASVKEGKPDENLKLISEYNV